MNQEDDTPTPEDFDAMLDGYAWVKASLLGDEHGRRAIAKTTDPVRLVDALASMVAYHLMMVSADPIRALDVMSAETVRNRESRR